MHLYSETSNYRIVYCQNALYMPQKQLDSEWMWALVRCCVSHNIEKCSYHITVRLCLTLF